MIASINTLPEALKKIKTIKMVSFDIFDTLLIRNIDHPEKIKKVISKCISLEQIFDLEHKEIYNLRIKCEDKLKRLHTEGEYSAKELYAEMLKSQGKSIRYLSRLLEIELKNERSMISKMQGIEPVLKVLKPTNKLIAISDTYLSKNMLIDLLLHVGLHNYFDEIYSSCDYKLNKGSGNLFKKIRTIEKVPNHLWLHIGDNFLGDYFSPKRLNINSILLYDWWNIHRRFLLKRASSHYSCPQDYKPFKRHYSHVLFYYVLFIMSCLPPSINCLFIHKLYNLKTTIIHSIKNYRA